MAERANCRLMPPAYSIVFGDFRPAPIFVDDFKFLRSVTRATPKITIPSPSTLHFRGGREAIDEAAYPRIEEFYADLARVYAEEIHDLAAVGCRYLQMDEVNLAYLCDPSLAESVRNIGEDLGSAVRGFKEGMKGEGEVAAEKAAAPQQVTAAKRVDAQTIDVETKAKS